jgi:2-phospho-L-lactate guanylyltransferase
LNIWAIVPVKNLTTAKSRLAKVLSPRQRSDLVLELTHHTLQVLCGWEILAGVVVVTADEQVERIAAAFVQVQIIHEPTSTGLNRSLKRACQDFKPAGEIFSPLIIPVDIPLLNRDSLLKVIKPGGSAPFVSIAPDEKERGTNALYLSQPDLIPYRFGRNSFQRHCNEAQLAGAALHVVRDHDLMFDLDTTIDWKRYKYHG